MICSKAPSATDSNLVAGWAQPSNAMRYGVMIIIFTDGSFGQISSADYPMHKHLGRPTLWELASTLE